MAEITVQKRPYWELRSLVMGVMGLFIKHDYVRRYKKTLRDY